MNLSEITVSNIAMFPDKWPTVMCYRELLSAVCNKLGCTMNEARDKYGLFTNAQWRELLNL